MFIAQTLSETCFDDEAQLHRTQVKKAIKTVKALDPVIKSIFSLKPLKELPSQLFEDSWH